MIQAFFEKHDYMDGPLKIAGFQTPIYLELFAVKLICRIFAAYRRGHPRYMEVSFV